MAWYIVGQAGMGLDGTVRTFEALGINSAVLEFAVLAEDVFSFSMLTTSGAGAGVDGVSHIPTIGQEVSLWKDGVRKFRGHCMAPKVKLDRVEVRVVGAYWWLAQIPISQVRAGAATGEATGERPSYVFPEQGLLASIQDLNNSARAAGVPIQYISDEVRGSRLTAMFTCLKTTVSGKSYADALCELMAWCPDAVAWFDHIGAGDVALRTSRRGTMEALTLTVGADVLECDIQPRLDLQAQRVELHYMERHPQTGLPLYARQSAGTGVAGKIQMVPVSGPDAAALIPKDDFENVAVKTVQWDLISNAEIKARDSELAAILKQFGSVRGGKTDGVTWYDGVSNNKVKYHQQFEDMALASVSGKALRAAQKYFVVSKDPLPEWAVKQLGAAEVDITGVWGAEWVRSQQGADPWNGVFTALRSGAFFLLTNVWENDRSYGGTMPAGGWGNADDVLDYAARKFTVRGYVIETAYPTLTTVYKQWAYDFLKPPANLAANMQAAQNWTPWEGSIVTIGDDVSGDNVLGKKVRLNGSLPVCAGMDALLKRVSYDIIGRRTTYTLGAPARTDYGSMVKRISRPPQDNIIYLD